MTVMEERFELASQRILEIEKEKRMPEQFQRYFAENWASCSKNTNG